MKHHDLVEITVIKIRQTDRAVLVHTGDVNDAVWIPLSQCELVSTDGGKFYTLSAPQWVLEEKELV